MNITATLVSILKQKQADKLIAFFDEYNIVDIATIVETLDVESVLYIFKTIDAATAGKLFSYLSNERQYELIQKFSGEEIRNILEHLYTDDIVYFLEELPANVVKDILRHTDSQRRDLVNQLLSYPQDCAGSIMSTSFVELNQYNTVEEAMALIKHAGYQAENITYCFVLDYKDRLLGIVSIREILFAPEDVLINDIMHTDVVYVNTRTDQEEVAKLMGKYDIQVVPVLDESRRFVGVITADDVVDVMEKEATEDMHKMNAVGPVEGSYLKLSPKDLAFSRVPWLLILLVAYSISSLVISANEGITTLYPALILFMPMLMDTTGNAGSQALAMVVRGIAVDEVTAKDWLKVLWKELRVALLCGICLFVVNMIRIYYFSGNSHDFQFALVVSLTVLIVVVIAKLVGGLLPFAALIFKQDPASMASPIVTTFCDSLSLLLYFTLAKALL